MTTFTVRRQPMSARILDGKRIAQELLERLRLRVAERVAHGLPAPGLAVVLVGDDAASSVYVRNKRKACHQVGFRSFDYDLPSATSQEQLFALIDRLNADPDVHGILVQSPLPEHIDEDALVDRIDPGKDVDGFQAVNVGRLALRRFGLRPCTPKGVMTLLGHTDRPVRGQHAVVVGVSNHVGRPLVLELMIAGCTTTSCHRFTRDLESFVRQADILVVPDLESGNMLAKQLEYLAEAEGAGIVLGARVPIILTSRADGAKSRLASCAVAALVAHAQQARHTGSPRLTV